MIFLILVSLICSLPAEAKQVKVLLHENKKKIIISSKHAYSLMQDGAELVRYDAGSETLVRSAPATANDFVLQNKGMIKTISGALYFKNTKSEDKPITVQRNSSNACAQWRRIGDKNCLGANQYRGGLRLHASADKKSFKLVNELDLEDYLRGVVTSEMPSGWPLEALKAQAVCARTYTLATLQHKSMLRPGVEDQVYRGYIAETNQGKKAVKLTEGLVLKSKSGQLIDAYYSSSAGNYSSSPDTTWGLSPRLNLLPVADDDRGSSMRSWTRRFSKGKLSKLLADLHLGQIKDIEVFDWSPEGRATKLVVHGLASPGSALLGDLKAQAKQGEVLNELPALEAASASTRYLTGEELRHKLGLPSTNFVLDTNWLGGYSFKGRGFGHGIGMSQYGAKNMASQGRDFKEILQHYYTNAEIFSIL